MRLSKIHEALDDKDEFRHDPIAPQRRIRQHPVKKCAFCSEVDMHSRPFWYDDQAWSYEAYGIKKEGKGNPMQFHMLHQHWAKLNDINIWNVRNDLALTDNFRVFMAKYGWVPKPGEYDDIFSWMKKPVQEALDDKDTFESCELCSLHLGNPTLADIENFHNAHTAADQEYGSGSGWHRVMARYGYRMGALGWEIIKEALDDKDEFTSGLIATGKIKEVNSYAGTEWVLTFTPLQGATQERIIYALPKVTFGKFSKYTLINGIKFDVEVIMDMDGTIGFYDDGDIREIIDNG